MAELEKDLRMGDSLANLMHDKRQLEKLADLAAGKLGDSKLAGSARTAAQRFEFIYNYFTQFDGLEKDLEEIEKAENKGQALADTLEKFGLDTNLTYVLKNIVANSQGNTTTNYSPAIKIDDAISYYAAEDYRWQFLSSIKIHGIQNEMMLSGAAYLHAYELLTNINKAVPEDGELGEFNKTFARHAAAYVKAAMPIANEKANK